MRAPEGSGAPGHYPGCPWLVAHDSVNTRPWMFFVVIHLFLRLYKIIFEIIGVTMNIASSFGSPSNPSLVVFIAHTIYVVVAYSFTINWPMYKCSVEMFTTFRNVNECCFSVVVSWTDSGNQDDIPCNICVTENV